MTTHFPSLFCLWQTPLNALHHGFVALESCCSPAQDTLPLAVRRARHMLMLARFRECRWHGMVSSLLASAWSCSCARHELGFVKGSVIRPCTRAHLALAPTSAPELCQRTTAVYSGRRA